VNRANQPRLSHRTGYFQRFSTLAAALLVVAACSSNEGADQPQGASGATKGGATTGGGTAAPGGSSSGGGAGNFAGAANTAGVTNGGAASAGASASGGTSSLAGANGSGGLPAGGNSSGGSAGGATAGSSSGGTGGGSSGTYACTGSTTGYTTLMVKSGSTWTVTKGAQQVHSGSDMEAALRAAYGSLSAGRSSKESILVQGSGDISASSQVGIPSYTVVNFCGTLNVSGTPSGSDRSPCMHATRATSRSRTSR